MEKVHKHFLSSKDNTSKISLTTEHDSIIIPKKIWIKKVLKLFLNQSKDNTSFKISIFKSNLLLYQGNFEEENI